MQPSLSIHEEIKRTGRVWLRQALARDKIPFLRKHADTPGRPGGRAGDGHPLVQGLAASGLTETLQRHWPKARPTRIVSFDKADGVNWKLPWHQDRVIAVQDKSDVPGFERWSRKDGVWHCEPPAVILQNMLFVRVHLDRSTRENGAMEIALQSHRDGCLSKDQIAERIGGYLVESTEASAGDVLVMSMMMVHRSPPAIVPGTRRVLRVDYALGDLPAPLNWAL